MLLFDIGKVCRTKISPPPQKKKYFFATFNNSTKTTPHLLEHIELQIIKVEMKTDFGRLATIFQICSMDADILSQITFPLFLI